jgi:hypothetical protein
MNRGQSASTLRRVASTHIPTKWGVFQTIGFERETSNGGIETALAIVLGDLKPDDAPLVRLHSQCFTGEVLGSLRCDCGDQLDLVMQAIAEAGAGLVIYEHQEGRGMIVVVDDEDRENEGDLTMAAEMITPEAAVDLARLAGLQPAGVICEIVNDDGTMARVPDLIRFCRKHGLLMITVAELARYRFDCDYEEALLTDDGLFPVPRISAVLGAPAPAELIA